MKSLLAILLIAATPALALAQSTAPAKPAAKSPAKKPAPKKSGKLAPSAQKAVEEVTPIEDDPSIVLSEADLEVARKVHVGDIPCELGATVKVMPMKREGMFSVMTGGHRFRMHPVESRTGAIRLEDPQRGAMWLQLGNKSMLMSQKLGQRLADECQSPAQVTYADMLKKNPLPSILEPLPGPQSTSPKAGPN
jgi:Ni/Co efflux regulator RcnB